MFSMLPTVLACFSTFSSNSLCLLVVKKPEFHGAILLIRRKDGGASGAGQGEQACRFRRSVRGRSKKRW
jgi:hypothetical protein